MLIILFLCQLAFASDINNITNLSNSSNYIHPSASGKSSIGLQFTPGLYGIEELAEINLYYIDKINQFPFSMNLYNLNNELYNEFKLNFGLGYKFDNFNASLISRYNNKSVISYQNEHFLEFDFAGNIDLNNDLFIGFYFQNILRDSREQKLILSLSKRIDDFGISLLSNYFLPRNYFISGILYYQISDNFMLNLSVKGNNPSVNLGLIFNINSLGFNPEIEFNSNLGFTQRYLMEYVY